MRKKNSNIVFCRGYHIVKSENERLGDAPDPLWLSRTAWNAAEEKEKQRLMRIDKRKERVNLSKTIRVLPWASDSTA
jgi:hypothetical protein